MPESSTRKAAAEKKKIKRHEAIVDARKEKAKPTSITRRRWVPPTFIAVGLLGVAWLITYYIAGTYIPQMAQLGNWNMLIGMGLLAASFMIATLWE